MKLFVVFVIFGILASGSFGQAPPPPQVQTLPAVGPGFNGNITNGVPLQGRVQTPANGAFMQTAPGSLPPPK
ncbi:hypothetical protein L596_008785 [Steinernema carpocapsae]|uniref:Uncharacterized protein n=1 Tax=Steinernema carpocapsae TaxID=34508 RepID=A0A4U5PDR2_STECR|nr:hypothetical protein L596_008785 [Steinernema carpocapsae]